VSNYFLQNYKIHKYFLQNLLRKVFYTKYFAKKLAAILRRWWGLKEMVEEIVGSTFPLININN